MEYWTPTPHPAKKSNKNKTAMDNTLRLAAIGTGINGLFFKLVLFDLAI
jgi:hypothetical protein